MPASLLGYTTITWGIFLKGRFSGTTSDPLNLNLWGWGPGAYICFVLLGGRYILITEHYFAP